jgi:hypothetical protein
MCSPDKLGIQLLFIPEEFGGMGGGTFDVYLICEEMARIDLGVATSVLATFLGSDPITVGATPEQKKIWLGASRKKALLFAYGATEPDAGSDLGALQTTADRVDGKDGDRRLQDQRQQAVDQQRRHRRIITPSWRTRPAGQPGSSWTRAPRDLLTTSPKTSTASVSATRRRWLSATCTSMPTGWSAASKARDCCRRRWSSATRA